MMILLANAKKPAAGAKTQTKYRYQKAFGVLQQQFTCFKHQITAGLNWLFAFKAAAI
jgi:hypothetical protein